VFAFAQFQIPDREIQYRTGDWVSYPVMRFATSIDMDQNTIYVGSTGGIARWNFFQKKWDAPYTRSDGLNDDQVRLLAFDFNTSCLWCATDGGLNVRLPGSEQWRQIPIGNDGAMPVSSLGIGRNYVWVQSRDAFFKTGHTGDAFSSSTAGEAEQDGVQWRGKMKAPIDGLPPNLFMDNGYLFNPEGVIIDKELRRYDVTAAVRDEFKNLWITSWGLGMGWADFNTFRLRMLPHGLYAPDVQAMAWDEGGMWIGGLHAGSASGGITHWDTDADEWNYFEARYTSQLTNDEVTAVVADTDAVWFGTTDGLVRYDKRGDAWRSWSVLQNLWSNSIRCVALGSGALWVGTDYGVNRISLPELSVDRMQDERLNHRRIYDIKTEGDFVWAGTDRGVYRYSRSQDKWDYLNGYAGMPVLEVTAVSVWRNEVWFGTDMGVEMLDKTTGEWSGFPENLYPTDGWINVVAADSDVVWVGMEGGGAAKYLKSENRWRVFTTADGLLDNSVRDILIDGDTVWFGTAKGLTRFYWNAPYRRD
jgi:ligand-binding sensor domain-containing protein